MKHMQIGPVDTKAIKAQADAEQRAKEDAWLLHSLGPKKYRIQKAADKALEDFFAVRDALPRRPLSPSAQAALDEARTKIRASYRPFLAEEYALLGIERDADKRTVKNAYRRKARKLHPDKGGTEADMKALNAAYHRLLAAIKE